MADWDVNFGEGMNLTVRDLDPDVVEDYIEEALERGTISNRHRKPARLRAAFDIWAEDHLEGEEFDGITFFPGEVTTAGRID